MRDLDEDNICRMPFARVGVRADMLAVSTIFRPCVAAQTCKLDDAKRNELFIAGSCTSDDSGINLDALPIGQECAYVCQVGYFSANSGEKMTCQVKADKTSAQGEWKVPGVGCKRA